MWRLFPGLCACLLALAGCGGGSDAPARSVTLGPGEPIRVTAEEYTFDPGRIVVRAGDGPLRIELDNRGDLAHDIEVLDSERELGGLPSFPGGETRATTVRVPPGSYRFVCTVADHEELGMEGELEVRP